MATSTRQISNDYGTIVLWDLINESTLEYRQEPCLEFRDVSFDSLWDNSNYLLNFFRGLKNKKKKQIKELKEFCEVNKLLYPTVKKDLLDIYKQSKKEKFWRKEIK